MIRIAAFGDIHVGRDSVGRLAPHLESLDDDADVLLVAGDLTKRGYPEEAEVFGNELAGVSIPKVAVLGNHDWEVDRDAEVVKILEDAGIQVLEGDSTLIDVDGTSLGVAGDKGLGATELDRAVTEFSIGRRGSGHPADGSPLTLLAQTARRYFASARANRP